MSPPTYLGILLSYLLGAVPFGYVTARLKGVDIFQAGSGNIGATNVGRVLGRRFGILVFVLDFLKGALPVALMQRYRGGTDAAAVAAGLAAFLGHLFPVYLRFRGGKGVATGFGVVAMLLPGPTLAAALVWVAVLSATHTVSLASLLAALALAVVRLVSVAEPFAEGERILTGFSLLAAALVALRHRANIARLLRGQENRVSDSPRLHMLARVLHVLALGLWFGSGVFFTFVAALSLFHTFEGFAQGPPSWLPLPADLTKEQGTRLAGAAVGPMFPLYFALQGLCGVVALITAWGWTKTAPAERTSRIRFAIVTMALALVLAGWPLVGKIEELRFARYAADEAVADPARAAFGVWHTVSLVLNLGTLVLVGIGLALAAKLPTIVSEPGAVGGVPGTSVSPGGAAAVSQGRQPLGHGPT
jgi:acyl-phosphate glycerol 3-phosphate acyltransferase